MGASVEPMKPLTAAKKLGIFLPATPEEFRTGEISHAQFAELQSNPPEWLAELRRNGPHPRPEVARKLGITITALKKNDMDKPLRQRPRRTTALVGLPLKLLATPRISRHS